MLIEHEEFRYSEHRTIRRGDLFRVTGGPTFGASRFGVRGWFRFISAYCKAKRWYVLCEAIEPSAIDHKTGKLSITNTHTLFVQGPSYPHPCCPGVMMRPYQIARVRQESSIA